MEVNLRLSVDQINQLLSLLATHPFAQVADLIGAIRLQAQQQLSPGQGPSPTMTTTSRPNGETRPTI